MIAEQVEGFILGLIEKSQKRELNWKIIDRLNNWEIIKKEIEKTKVIDLKDYFIEDGKSYGINKSDGYVMVLTLRYGNAPVFSSALDKYVLIIKINDDFLPVNLSTYDAQGYKDLLKKLVEEIEAQQLSEIDMPDCMYNFFEKILE